MKLFHLAVHWWRRFLLVLAGIYLRLDGRTASSEEPDRLSPPLSELTETTTGGNVRKERGKLHLAYAADSWSCATNYKFTKKETNENGIGPIAMSDELSAAVPLGLR